MYAIRSYYDVAFRFKSICLTNPDAVRYRYRLEGVENEWQMVSTQNQVTYQTLPPGRYNFQVMACNSSGVWNRQPDRITSYNVCYTKLLRCLVG